MINSILNNIWIINLDKSTARMETIKKNFDTLGLKFNRFSAIYGKNLSQENIDNISLIKYVVNYYVIIV